MHQNTQLLALHMPFGISRVFLIVVEIFGFTEMVVIYNREITVRDLVVHSIKLYTALYVFLCDRRSDCWSRFFLKNNNLVMLAL